MKLTVIGVGAVAAGMLYLGLNGIATQIRAPQPPVIEFQGPPLVSDVKDGKATFTFLVKRNEPCPTTVHIRWFNIDRKAFDVGSARDVESTQAPVTESFEPFSVTLDLPDKDATWAYAPIFTFTGPCADRKAVQAPMAEVKP